MSEPLDRRLHPVRPDLAARAYEGKVKSERFVDGHLRMISAPVLDFRKEPRKDCGIDTQGLFGELVEVFDETAEGWAWGQLQTDGYVGWFSSDGLQEPREATHRVSALATFRYPGPDLKFPIEGRLTIGARVSVVDEAVTRDLRYARLTDGTFVVAHHLVPARHMEKDWVKVAEQFLNVPYLWGGRSGAGLDCSALVQLSAAEGGIQLPRDSDMQQKDAGISLPLDTPIADLERGDLIFWRGHVGIVQGPNQLLHANGRSMTVACEPLDAAIERIGANEFGAVTAIRRLA